MDSVGITASTLPATRRAMVKLTRIIDFAITAIFAISATAVAYGLLNGETVAAFGDASRAGKDNLLMVAECILGLAAVHLPDLIKRLFRFEISTSLRALFSAFLFGAIYLGEVQNFYYIIPYWDVILHCTSGFMIAYLGFELLQTLCERSSGTLKLPPVFCAVFAFFIALGIGGIWELYEYMMDGLLGLNMQKAILGSGEILAGHAAITDTMKDVLVDCVGAVSASLFCCFSAKHKKAQMSVRCFRINISQTILKYLSNNRVG
ncbi:MAG: hypothetical protein LBN26_04835 [Christensenellaceae bacterium]|jgi:uncharacterized membrane protein YjdF|nr:hypothetical protein [Christensenellaceae bacterium]